jgi:hypothetical protein
MNALTPAPSRTGAPAAAEHGQPPVAPIVAAVDASAASRAAAEEAVVLASELEAPLVFVYVRRGPPPFLGSPFYQRRLSKEMERARRVPDRALRVARVAEVEAEAVILGGSPHRLGDRPIRRPPGRRRRPAAEPSRARSPRLTRTYACAKSAHSFRRSHWCPRPCDVAASEATSGRRTDAIEGEATPPARARRRGRRL